VLNAGVVVQFTGCSIFGEKFAGSVAKQLVQSDLQGERVVAASDHQLFIAFTDKSHVL